MLCFHAAQTGKHLLWIQNVSEQNQKHFLCRQQMLRAWANGETFVLATICPRLPGPIGVVLTRVDTTSPKDNNNYKQDPSDYENNISTC